MASTMDGHWANAVPLDGSTGVPQQQQHRTETWTSQNSDMSRRSSQQWQNDYNIMSDSEAAGSRRASIRASNASANRKRSRNQLKEKKVEKTDEYIDDSAWIHRDKLAQIEIQEMEEAGIHVRSSQRSSSYGPEPARRSSRSASRSGTRRAMSRDRASEGEAEGNGPLHTSFDDYPRKRVSTIPAADEEEHDQAQDSSFDPRTDSEIRTPEEIAHEQQVAAMKPHPIRPSTSRIPISKISAVPVPQEVVDRDSPLPRSRSGSGAYTSNWDDMQYARRARSNSIGSQVLLDEPDAEGEFKRDALENSPPKARIPNKAKPMSSGRSASASATANGAPRAASNTMTKAPALSPTGQRPVSRSGHRSRPSTGHAPEGEAPWIATMYKPDPRLPPDQQMLPTHAKRMMQEQWEKDGKTGTAYDRDFRLLNDQEFQQPTPRTSRTENPTLSPPAQSTPSANLHTQPTSSPRKEFEQPWPLTPAKSDTKSETGSVRPGTSGGYKITPTIQPSPTKVQRHSSNTTNEKISADGQHTNESATTAPPRMPDLDEKDEQGGKKKGGCGCCIVM